MAEAATTGSPRNVRHKPAGSSTSRPRGDSPLACAIEGAFAAHHGRSPQRKQLDGMVAVAKWLMRCRNVDGLRVHRSIPQAARALAPALGWEVDGLTVRELKDRYRNQVERRLDYLAEIGVLVDHREAAYGRDRRGAGIVVHLRADVAQLAKAPKPRPRGHGSHGTPPIPHTRRRRSSAPARSVFSADQLSPPSGEPGVYGPKGPTPGSSEQKSARARRAGIDARNAVRGDAAVAVAPPDRDPGLTTGRGVVAAPPPASSVYAALAEAWAARTGRPCRRTNPARWAPVAETACRRMVRYGYAGRKIDAAGALAAAVELVAEHPSDDWPATLAAFVWKLDWISRDCRHAAKHRAGKCGPRCRRSTDAMERAGTFLAQRDAARRRRARKVPRGR